MPYAQMPEPVTPNEHPPVQEPTEPATPIEDPAPGQSFPEIPVPERLGRVAGCLLAVLMVAAPLVVRAQNAPQAAVPAPLPSSARPDIPGGSTKDGVARPPGIADRGINQTTPPQTEFTTPVIKPPGTAGSSQPVVPK